MAAVFLVLLFLVLGISLYTYIECFYSPAKQKNDPYEKIEGEQYSDVFDNMLAITRIMDKASSEEVSITSYDGLKLKGRYYHTNDGAPVQLLFHGYRSHALRDCAGAYILAKKMGFNVLAVDQRAHSKSCGRVITFGICERFDCVSWTHYVNERFPDSPMILGGLSMGAATVLMASELDLPENVTCIIADCPYSSPKAIIRRVCRDRGIPDTLAYPFIRIGARLFGVFSLEGCSAETAVRHAKVPILLIHGEDDRFVPCEMSRRIHRSCAALSQLHTFPYAGHGLCYMTDPLRYEKITTRFLWNIPALRPHMEQSSYVQKELFADSVDY